MNTPPKIDASRPVGFEVPARLLSEELAEEPQPVIEGYAVARLLGRGARSAVYRVFKRGSHTPLALKLMTVAAPPGQAAQDLVRSLSKLELNHTATVLECGEHQGRLFILSQFIDGIPLAEHGLSPWKTRTVPARVELLAKIADGVAELHEQGLSHGALSPGNVLVTAEGEPVLVDLGVEAVLRGAAPAPSEDLASLASLAPLVLCEIVPAAAPSGEPPGLPEPVRAALRRLRASAQGAPSTAAEFASELRAWLTNNQQRAQGVWLRLLQWLPGRA